MLKCRFLPIVLALCAVARAQDAKIAVAANFTGPAKQIAVQFHAATGESVTLSFGSSGQFVAAIVNGAPYDVLLSADVDHARKIETSGLAVPGTRFTYAIGHLVLWSGNPALAVDQGKSLSLGVVQHIAIADPKLAPYGLATEQYLRSSGFWTLVSSKLVIGKSIAQAFEFVKSGNAEVGFVALSQVIHDKSGAQWLVPDSSHAPITQQAVLLKHGAKNKAAADFLAYLKGSTAAKIMSSFGYN